MKATLRRSGKHMVTMRIRYDLDRFQAGAILAMERESFDLGGRDNDPLSSRATAERSIRDHLSVYGFERINWYSDHITEQDPDEAIAEVEEILEEWGWQ